MASAAAAKWGDGESGRRRRAGWVEGFGGEVVARGNGFLVKSNLAVGISQNAL